MKAIQITIDEALLARLDADAEVRCDGRSAVFRRAVSAYLRNRRYNEIRERYQAAYGDGQGLDEDFVDWEEQGAMRTRLLNRRRFGMPHTGPDVNGGVTPRIDDE